MELSGKTVPFAVLGHPIGHSLSPIMHNASLRALKRDAIYLAFDVHPERLMTVLPAMHEMGFAGINLTVPLKEVAFRGLTDLAESARLTGSVNTVECRADDTLRGHSTDGDGFLRALVEAFDEPVDGRLVFLLGCGGAGRAVAFAVAPDCAGLVLADQDPARATGLAADLRGAFPACSVSAVPPSPEAWTNSAREAELIVQATPVGMHADDPSPLPASAFHAGQRVFDLIYMTPETAIMRPAARQGARVSNGLGMLLHQGAIAYEIWTGDPPDIAAMRTALQSAVYGGPAT